MNQDQSVLFPFQKEALDFLCREKDVAFHLLVQSTTGSGKSRIFEEWMRRSPGKRFLLVSPLVALAEQQIEKLKSYSICAGRPEEVLKEDTDVHPKVCVISPESLFHFSVSEKRFRLKNWVKKFNPDFLIVDECHCVWSWGARFRPAYKQVLSLGREYPFLGSLWLSASFSRENIPSWKSLFSEKASVRVQGDFRLPESLQIQVEKVSYGERVDRLLFQIALYHQAEMQTLVFANTKSMAEKISRLLNVPYYHSGLFLEEKRAIQKKLASKKLNTIVCTSAFGMGVDLPHLDNVLVWQLPFSLLDLVQQLGRAARQGRRGVGMVFWEEEDFFLLERFQRNTHEIKRLKNWVHSKGDYKAELLRFF